MSEQTVSVSFSVEQINELLNAEPLYSSGPRPQFKLIFETETAVVDPNSPMFRIVVPNREIDPELKAEFDSWEAASDEDMAKFESSLE